MYKSQVLPVSTDYMHLRNMKKFLCQIGNNVIFKTVLSIDDGEIEHWSLRRFEMLYIN